MREPVAAQGRRDMAGATISALITEAERGNHAAADQLFNVLYRELHRLAKRQLARQGVLTLSATTLIHEAYLDITSREGPSFPDTARFLTYAGRVMRGVIIDHVRRRLALKRGGQFELTAVPADVVEQSLDDQELMRISEALNQLLKVDGSLAQIVDLKFFCGFSFAEIAQIHGLSERTVQRKWEKARIYLHRTLRASLPV